MRVHELLEDKSPRFYVLKAFRYMFAISPILMTILIILTIINSFSATVNASLTYVVLTSISSTIENNQDFQFIIGAVVLMILAMIFFPFILSLEGIVKIRITQKLNMKIKARLMEKISKIEYEYFDDMKVYDISTRTLIETELKITETVYNTLVLLSNVISAIGISCIVISVAWWMFPLSILGSIPMLFVKFKSSDELNKAEKEMTFFNRVSSYVSSIILNKESMKEIKLFNTFDYLKNIWKTNLDKSFKRTLAVQSKYGKRGALINILYVWVGTPFTFINILFVIRGTLTMADYLILLDTVGKLGLILVHEIPNSFGKIRKYKQFWNDWSVLWGLNNVSDEDCLELADSQQFNIKFNNVFFHYPKCDKDILKGVSFTIHNGEKVAIVGENGAGKSTIINLLLGLYKPSSGSVTINGYDVSAISTQTRKRIMSCVFQNYTKYFLSVRENIGFGDIDSIEDTEQIKKAAIKGGADSFIQQMPQKYDTLLGNIYGVGTDLSEGQWQKINIAKAYNMDSNIIILDEPTASLDPIAEAEIYNTFKNLAEDKTCLLVSHRLGSAQIGDRILVIHNGRILEDGSHKQLMKNNAKYLTMFESQSKWYKGK